MEKQTISYSNFEALDIRVGKIIEVTEAATRKPTYRIMVDFGNDIGTKMSCGAYRNYRKEELVGKLVAAVINFEPKQMGPEKSEVLILGVNNEKNETIYLTTQANVPLGAKVF